MIVCTDPFWSLFTDRPGIPQGLYKNYSFSATTTLFGIDDSILTPIISYTWDYKVINGITWVSPTVGVTEHKVNDYYLK